MAKRMTEVQKWTKRYNQYLKAVDKLEAKGRIMNRLDKSDFRDQWETEHKMALKEGDPKRSIISKIARESTEFNLKQISQIDKYIKENQIKSEDGQPADARKLSRNNLWDYLMATNSNDYDATRAQYNEFVPMQTQIKEGNKNPLVGYIIGRK